MHTHSIQIPRIPAIIDNSGDLQNMFNSIYSKLKHVFSFHDTIQMEFKKPIEELFDILE